jgi:hypothetical protein
VELPAGKATGDGDLVDVVRNHRHPGLNPSLNP